MKIMPKAAMLAAFLTATAAHAAVPLRIAVDPDADGASAQRDLTWRIVPTIDAALSALREARLRFGFTDDPVEIVLAPGTWRLDRPIAFTQGTGGTPAAPVVLRAEEPGRTVLSGARPVEGFDDVADEAVIERLPKKARGNVLVASLPASTFPDLGRLTRRGFEHNDEVAHAEVFYKGQRMQLARWPNDRYLGYADLPERKARTGFLADAKLPAGIGYENDLWAFGYFGNSYGGEHLPVRIGDGKRSEVRFRDVKPRYGLNPKEGRYFLENALAALDAPGEWYMDRAARRLYFWPPDELEDGDVEVSQLESLVRADGARHVTLSGLVLEGARGDAVVARGVEGFRLEACEIRSIGNKAAVIEGRNSGVAGCRIHGIGDSAVALSGGDPEILRPAANYLTDSKVHDYGQWTRVYTAAASLQGVGHYVERNDIQDAPQMGVYYSGNDHVIKDNLFNNLGWDAGDFGVIYKWQELAGRGTLISGNTLCNVQPYLHFAIGIYLDLLAGGEIITDNRLYNVDWGMLINGGSANFIARNTIVGSEYAIRYEPIGMTWSKKSIQPDGVVSRSLRGVPWQGGAYERRYAGLPTALDGERGMPRYNTVVDNTFVDSERGFFTSTKTSREWQLIQGNRTVEALPEMELKRLFPPVCLAGKSDRREERPS